MALHCQLIVIHLALVLNEERVRLGDIAVSTVVSKGQVAVDILEQAALLANASAQLAGVERRVFASQGSAVETSVY